MPVNDAAFRVRADGVDWLKTWFLNPTHSDKIPIGASSESLPLAPAMAKARPVPEHWADLPDEQQISRDRDVAAALV